MSRESWGSFSRCSSKSRPCMSPSGCIFPSSPLTITVSSSTYWISSPAKPSIARKLRGSFTPAPFSRTIAARASVAVFGWIRWNSSPSIQNDPRSAFGVFLGPVVVISSFGPAAARGVLLNRGTRFLERQLAAEQHHDDNDHENEHDRADRDVHAAQLRPGRPGYSLMACNASTRKGRPRVAGWWARIANTGPPVGPVQVRTFARTGVMSCARVPSWSGRA